MLEYSLFILLRILILVGGWILSFSSASFFSFLMTLSIPALCSQRRTDASLLVLLTYDVSHCSQSILYITLVCSLLGVLSLALMTRLLLLFVILGIGTMVQIGTNI